MKDVSHRSRFIIREHKVPTCVLFNASSRAALFETKRLGERMNRSMDVSWAGLSLSVERCIVIGKIDEKHLLCQTDLVVYSREENVRQYFFDR